jgi:polyketide cyclase/dehydrase/lipid transport protein
MFKTILKWGGAGLGVFVGGVLAYAATKPNEFRVQRTITINAPQQAVFALVNDYRNWATWSPWERKDPNIKRIYSGPPSGKGAVYAWDGNSEVGKGSMLITEATPSRVALNLDFEKPFEGHNKVVFTMESMGLTTDVTWSMEGPSPFFAKVMQVFCNMDKMIGTEFENGLAALKAEAEKKAAAQQAKVQ